MAAEQSSRTRRSLAWIIFNRVSIDAVKIRRRVLFLVNIGVPLVVGAITGQSQAALPAVVLGMLFGFADSEGPLLSRLRLLALDAGCIVAGASAGYFARNNPAALWSVFVAMALAVGMAPRAGRELLLTGRHAIMAFMVAAAIPTISLIELSYLFGVLLLAAVTRTVDYMIAGRLPRQRAAPLQMPSGRGSWLRFAIAFAGAATAALWLGETLDPIHTIWVVTTTLVVMQPDARASYRRIVERIAGTFAGVFIAWKITMGFHSVPVICAAILIVAPLIPHHLANRYWLHTALIALLVLLAYDFAELDTQGISKLLPERVIDMLLGCATALVGTAVAFPRGVVAEIDDAADAPLSSRVSRHRKPRAVGGDDGLD